MPWEEREGMEPPCFSAPHLSRGSLVSALGGSAANELAPRRTPLARPLANLGAERNFLESFGRKTTVAIFVTYGVAFLSRLLAKLGGRAANIPAPRIQTPAKR